MSVSDTGIGIPPEKLDHVFDEFSQADVHDARLRRHGARPAISRRFCQMMGGDITVESTVGEGSTFTIRLPVVVEARKRKTAEGTYRRGSGSQLTPEARGGDATVLVIDDDPNALDLLGRTLAREPAYRVVTRQRRKRRAWRSRGPVPDAITLDVMMPGMDGWEVLRALKADAETRPRHPGHHGHDVRRQRDGATRWGPPST